MQQQEQKNLHSFSQVQVFHKTTIKKEENIMQERNNSDNEDTMLLPEDMDNYATEYPANDLPPLKRKRPQQQRRSNGYEQYRDDRRDANGNPYSTSQPDYDTQFSRPESQQYQRQNAQGQYSRTQQYQRPNGQRPNYNNQQYQRQGGQRQNYNNQQYQRQGGQQTNRNNQQYQRQSGQRPNRNNQQYQRQGGQRQNYNDQQYQRQGGQRQNYNNGQYRQSSQPNYHYYNDRPDNYRQPSQPAYVPPPQPARPKQKKAPRKKHKSLLGKIIKRILWSLIIIFLLIFGAYSCTSLSLIGKVNKVPSAHHSHSYDALKASYVRSILILGTDNRGDETGRSDSMILLSINTRTHEMTMTSFMRDCYVEIPDYGWNKLNAAYAFGGADLLMETIENNFKVRIDDYVSIDFLSFSSIVDSVGGLDMDVSDEEAAEINIILQAELNELMGDDRYADLLESGGYLHLNGKQALAYARIRNVGNSDFERTGRQRKVIELILNKVKTLRPSIFTNIAKNVIPDVSTNMSTLEMYLYSLKVPFALRYDRKQIQVPYDDTFGAEDVWIGNDLMNVLTVDFGANYDRLKEDVFGTQRTVPQYTEEPVYEDEYQDYGY